MRSDSLPRLQEEPAWQALAPVFFSLHAMPATEFKAVIEGPARRHTETVKSLVIEPRLVEQLVIDAQGADALPLLALTLEWLYREFTNAEGTRVGKDEYDGLGGVRGVIDIAVKRAFERPDAAPVIPVNAPSQERLLHQVFPAIATVDPDSGEWKRRVAVRESLRAQATQADAMVSRLIEQRLLVADLRRVAAGGEPVEVFEVAHETLLRQWEALRRWLTEFAEALSAAESLRRAANDWQRHERDEVMLVHAGHRLEAAEALVADARLQGRFELIDRDYVAACRQRAQREADDREAQLQRIAEQQAARATLQRRAAWVLSVTALLVLGLVGWIVVQTRAVSVQTSLVLAGAAEAAAAAALSDQSMRLAVLATRATWLHPAHANAGPALSRAAESRTLRIVLGGHGAAVRSATFSSDGQRILTVSNDETARLLNAETGAAIGAPMTHAKRIVSAGFSANGERIVTASSDQGVRVWDGATGNALGPPLDRGHAVAFAGLSPDGKRLITGLHNQTARIWDAGTGKAVGGQINYFASSAGFRDDFPAASVAFRSDGARAVVVAQTRAHILDAETGRVVGEALEHGAEISSATFSPDGKWIVTSSWDKTARVWDAETGKQIGEPMKHIDGIVSASFSPGSDRVVTASRDWTANVWDAATGKSISGAMTHAGAVSSAVFSNDGRRVLTASTDTTARLWDSETGQSIGEPLAHADEVLSASFSPNDKRIVTASKDRHVRIWDTEPNKIVTNAMAHKGSVSAVSFSADGKRIVTAANDDNSAHLWNAETAESIGEPMTHERPVTSVSFSRDGTRVVTASGDSTARIWDAYTGRPIVSPMMHDHVVWSAEFSPDDRRVVTASADKTARLWDVETGRMVGAVMKHGAAVSSARFSAEGKRIVTASQDKTARLWDAETGKALGQPMVHVETVLTARFSPDDKRVVSGSEDKTARIWDGETGATIGKPIVHEDVVFFADFSPDGKHILTGSGAAARMWDATGASVGEPMLHQGDLAATQYSLDGRRIVTGSADRTARVWDAATGKPMGLPMTHGRVVSAVSFSPDGQRVVTGSWDRTARVWSASWPAISDPETLIAEACRKKLPGNLRRLTEADIRAAPIITAQRVGEDVCAGVAEREK